MPQNGVTNLSLVPSITCDQFWPYKGDCLQSEYRHTICNKPAPKREGLPKRFFNIDRGNINDSLSLIKALRRDGGGGVSRYVVDTDLQYEDRLESHRGTKTSRYDLLEEIELEGQQSEYMKTYGKAVKLPMNKKGYLDEHPCRLAYGNTLHQTYQLVKKLREEGGGGTSVYHVAPEVRVAEREWRMKDKSKYMGHAREHEYPRSNVTGMTAVGQPGWVSNLTETTAEDALRTATMKLQDRSGGVYTRLQKPKSQQGRSRSRASTKAPSSRPQSAVVSRTPVNKITSGLTGGASKLRPQSVGPIGRSAGGTKPKASRPISALSRGSSKDWVTQISHRSRPSTAVSRGSANK